MNMVKHLELLLAKADRTVAQGSAKKGQVLKVKKKGNILYNWIPGQY